MFMFYFRLSVMLSGENAKKGDSVPPSLLSLSCFYGHTPPLANIIGIEIFKKLT